MVFGQVFTVKAIKDHRFTINSIYKEKTDIKDMEEK